MTNGEEFRAYMKAANRNRGNEDDRHLSEPRMIAYCRGEMSEAEREAAQSHLVECEQCIALFRSAGDFLEPAGANDDEIATAETNDEWQSLWRRVQEVSSTNAGTTVAQDEFQRRRDRKLPFTSRITLALAASLLIFCGAFGWLAWSFRQERRARQQSQEAALQLERKQRALEQRLSQVEQGSSDELKREREQRIAAEAERDRLEDLLAAVHPGRDDAQNFSFTLSSDRGSAQELLLPLTTAAKAVRLRLFRSKPYEFQQYTLELLDQSGARVWETSGVRPAPGDGALSVRLDRAKLSAGKYKLRLFGREGQTNKPLGEYGLTVTVR
ncbi:MAG: zf-HC2 domain-containing protein [Pyrinomonadaceae bacterium]